MSTRTLTPPPPGRPATRLRCLALACAGAAVLLTATAGPTRGPDLPVAAAAGALVAVLAASVLAEAGLVALDYGRGAHAVSLSDLVLTVGLAAVPPGPLVAARAAAAGIAAVVLQRQRPVKAACNTGFAALEAAVAVAVVAAWPWQLRPSLADLLPVAVGVLAGATAAAAGAALAVAATTGRLAPPAAARTLLTGLAAGATCACLGLVVLAAWAWAGAEVLLPLAVAAGGLAAGYAELVRLRGRAARTEQLFGVMAAVGASPAADVARTVLAEVLTVLRASRAGLWVRSGDDEVLVTRLDGGGGLSTRTERWSGVPDAVQQAFAAHRPLVVPRGDRRVAARALLASRRARDAVLAPFRSSQGLQGVLLVVDRHGDASTFGRQDGQLLAAIAAQTGTALANAALVDRLDHDSTHDALTGLANRSRWTQALEAELAAGRWPAVLLMDLDRFKEINDTLGHHQGDRVLCEVARRLRAAAGPEPLLARLGGDEFAVLLRDALPAAALRHAHTLRDALSAPVRSDGLALPVGASVGVAVAGPGRGEAADRAAALLQHADVAMYAAKHRGGGVAEYRPDLDAGAPRRLALASSLLDGLAAGQFTAVYQPQADLADGRVLGVEALLRWQHPLHGAVSPADFIGLAEQTGAIREVLRFVLHEALRACAAWRADGIDLAVSVNISVRNLLEHDLVESVAAALAEHGVPPHALTLEVTESHLMADAARSRMVLERLAGLGLRLAIDDFGTGYSSLAYLKDLPVAEVKIDRSFVAELVGSASDAVIVRATVELGHALGLEVVAEGVEDETTLEALRRCGCDRWQGYHLARPLPLPELRAWLRAREGRPCAPSLPRPRSGGQPRSAHARSSTPSSASAGCAPATA